MNALNNPKFLLNNKTFQTIYGRNLLHELNRNYRVVPCALGTNHQIDLEKSVQ